MTFLVDVIEPRWTDGIRSRLGSFTENLGGRENGRVVPVIKGNGYGVGREFLLGETAALGCEAVAVGTIWEAAGALSASSGDVVVLNPFEPRDPHAIEAWRGLLRGANPRRVIATIADPVAMQALSALSAESGAPIRAVVELRTSMSRFGLSEEELGGVVPELSALQESGVVAVEGISLHLPLVQPSGSTPPPSPASLGDPSQAVVPARSGSARAREVVDAVRRWWTAAEQLAAPAVWVSHLDPAELAVVRDALPGVYVNHRIGTGLWLGDRGALRAAGTLLAVHRVQSGDHVGYRQRRARSGFVLVVGGGTAHGIGLAAPSAASTLRQRAVAAGTGLLDAGGRALSPFSWNGLRLWFAEPPHMQVSMLWLPDRQLAGRTPPEVGDQLPCEVRFTGILPDAVNRVTQPT